MKRLSLLVITLLLMVACNVNEDSEQSDNESDGNRSTVANIDTARTNENGKSDENVSDDNDEEQDEHNEPNNEPEEVIEIPTERTVDLMGNYPWQFYHTQQIEELQNDGETIYLFSDAEEAEKAMVGNAEYGKDGDVAARYWELFIREVEPVVEGYDDYFDKLREIVDMFRSEEYEDIPDLVEEAKELRE